MKFQLSACAAAVAAAAILIPIETNACSTIIVGKDVSKTGTVIVGHNEDNGGRILSAQYYVPPATHKAGEMIKFEPKAAAIPQVEKTYGFYWTQTFAPNGASFSDGFVNDKGVSIVSNACTTIFPENVQELKDGGIGYGIRRLMAERAATAREAVQIAIDLLGKYGYFSEGRTYTVADPNEAWQIAIHQGNTWAARKVADNEVVYIPNNFMMNSLDATDKDNVIIAPGVIERAIEQGRYKPAQQGVFKDFNYREAVQPASKRAMDYNKTRNNIAWKKILGQNITDPEKFPYSATPANKLGVEDVKDLLRSHEAGIGKASGWFHQKGFGICRPTTHESLILVMNENPIFIKGYRTLAQPCETPYVPFYPLAKAADGTHFMDWQTANAQHFNSDKGNFSYRPDWPIWSFINHANHVDYQKAGHGENLKFVKNLEKQLSAKDGNVQKTAQALAGISQARALEYLHNYNVQKFDQARAAVEDKTAQIAPYSIAVLAEKIDPKSDEPVEIVLFADKGLSASKVNKSLIRAGVGRASVGAKGAVDSMAKPVSSRLEDINNDGKKDLVLGFSQKELAKDMVPNAVYDVWLYAVSGNKEISAFDVVSIGDKVVQVPDNKVEIHDQ